MDTGCNSQISSSAPTFIQLEVVITIKKKKKISPGGLYPVNHTPLFLILRGLIEDKQRLWYSKHQDSHAHKRMHCLPSNLQCCFWDEKKMRWSCNRYPTCELMGFSLVEKKPFFLSNQLFFQNRLQAFSPGYLQRIFCTSSQTKQKVHFNWLHLIFSFHKYHVHNDRSLEMNMSTGV